MKTWKTVYEEMYFATKKRARATKAQINNIKSNAKLLAAIYYR